MNGRFLSLYQSELQHLRGMGVEFARSNPAVARGLDLRPNECQDPWVERLLEGFAFLAARTALKLEAEFPHFTQSLLGTIYPHYLAPTPSVAIVSLEPDPAQGDLSSGHTIERGFGLLAGEGASCRFETAHDVTLWPVKVQEARYYTRELPLLRLPGRTAARSAIRLRLATVDGSPMNECPLDSLTFYIDGPGAMAMRIYEHLFAHVAGVVVRPAGDETGAGLRPGLPHIEPVGFEDEQSLLPHDERSFSGYRLLREYFTFPQRYLFFKISEIAAAECADSMLDVILLLDIEDPLLDTIEAGNFRLFCTPVVNLFHKRDIDRIEVTGAVSEFKVTPDKMSPDDFEIFEITEVAGFDSRYNKVCEFQPFYAAQDSSGEAGGSYYTVQRRQRALSEREQQYGRRTHYAGSDVFISLVDSNAAPFRPDIRSLSVRARCTNRGLPLRLAEDNEFSIEKAAPVRRATGLAKADPRPSYAERDFSWRVINHLKLNYMSLQNDSSGKPAALHDLLRVYSDQGDPALAKQIEGLVSIATSSKSARVPGPGPIAFARGLHVELTLDEANFEGTGAFLLGAVLEKFFAKYVSINSFTQTTVHSVQRGKVIQWPPRVGQRGIF